MATGVDGTWAGDQDGKQARRRQEGIAKLERIVRRKRQRLFLFALAAGGGVFGAILLFGSEPWLMEMQSLGSEKFALIALGLFVALAASVATGQILYDALFLSQISPLEKRVAKIKSQEGDGA